MWTTSARFSPPFHVYSAIVLHPADRERLLTLARLVYLDVGATSTLCHHLTLSLSESLGKARAGEEFEITLTHVGLSWRQSPDQNGDLLYPLTSAFRAAAAPRELPGVPHITAFTYHDGIPRDSNSIAPAAWHRLAVPLVVRGTIAVCED